MLRKLGLSLIALSVAGIAFGGEIQANITPKMLAHWDFGQSFNGSGFFKPSAGVTVYDNTVNYSGFGATYGGATAITGTKVLADDVNLASLPAGGKLEEFTFVVANFDTVGVNARFRTRFWTDSAGAPGTLWSAIVFNPITFPVGLSAWTTGSLAGSGLDVVIPSSALWVGNLFDAQGGATATVAQLNNLGMGLFDPPVVGSSADKDWLSTSPGSNAVNNPVGSVRNPPYPGTAIVGSYGWEFQATPEPSTIAGLGMMLTGLAGMKLRRRK